MIYYITTIDKDNVTRYYRNTGIRWITKIAGAQAFTANQLDAVVEDIKTYHPEIKLSILPQWG